MNGHEVNAIDLIAGRRPDPAANDQVVVERHTADTFGLTMGARLQVFDGAGWREMTIAGVAESPEFLWPARTRQDERHDDRDQGDTQVRDRGQEVRGAAVGIAHGGARILAVPRRATGSVAAQQRARPGVAQVLEPANMIQRELE